MSWWPHASDDGKCDVLEGKSTKHRKHVVPNMPRVMLDVKTLKYPTYREAKSLAIRLQFRKPSNN